VMGTDRICQYLRI